MPARRYPRILLLASLLMAPVLAGCAPVILAGAAGASAMTFADARDPATVLRDTRIQTAISERWLRHGGLNTKLDVEVREGRALLTGVVQDPDMRVEAVRLAWQVDGVEEVINEIQVEEGRGLRGFAVDTAIISELRSRMLVEPGIQSLNYSLESVNGVVYVMGIAQTEAERDKVLNIARNIRRVRRVVSYVRLASEDPPS